MLCCVSVMYSRHRIMRIMKLPDKRKSSNNLVEEIREYQGIMFQRYVELYQKLLKISLLKADFSYNNCTKAMKPARMWRLSEDFS